MDYEFSVAALQICYCSVGRGEPMIGCMGRRDEFSNETAGVVVILFNVYLLRNAISHFLLTTQGCTSHYILKGHMKSMGQLDLAHGF